MRQRLRAGELQRQQVVARDEEVADFVGQHGGAINRSLAGEVAFGDEDDTAQRVERPGALADLDADAGVLAQAGGQRAKLNGWGHVLRPNS